LVVPFGRPRRDGILGAIGGSRKALRRHRCAGRGASRVPRCSEARGRGGLGLREPPRLIWGKPHREATLTPRVHTGGLDLEAWKPVVLRCRRCVCSQWLIVWARTMLDRTCIAPWRWLGRDVRYRCGLSFSLPLPSFRCIIRHLVGGLLGALDEVLPRWVLLRLALACTDRVSLGILMVH